MAKTTRCICPKCGLIREQHRRNDGSWRECSVCHAPMTALTIQLDARYAKAKADLAEQNGES